MAAYGAAVVEALRAELALAKEQARRSDAAALKAAEELKAEQAAHCQSKKVIAEMAIELKDAVDRYELLEKENQAKAADLKKAVEAAKETRSQIRAAKEELCQAGDITAGKPFLLQMKFGDPKYAPWISCGVLRTRMCTWRRVLLMRPSFSKSEKIMKWKSCSGRSSVLQRVRCC